MIDPLSLAPNLIAELYSSSEIGSLYLIWILYILWTWQLIYLYIFWVWQQTPEFYRSSKLGGLYLLWSFVDFLSCSADLSEFYRTWLLVSPLNFIGALILAPDLSSELYSFSETVKQSNQRLTIFFFVRITHVIHHYPFDCNILLRAPLGPSVGWNL